MNRRSSNDGHRGHVEHHVGTLIRPSLVDAALGPSPPLQRKPAEQKVYHGPKGRKVQPLPPGALPDQTILEVRALREFLGWTYSRIADRYDLDPNRVASICKYTTRGHLVPAWDHVPPDCRAA